MTPPIFKLPDELFLKIADYVDQQYPLQYYQLDRDTSILPIVNFSMTCRRFRQVSAHLLVNTVTVEMTQSSLEHFEEISRHPSIHKGVRDVHISLRYFSRDLCEDFAKFRKFYAEELERHIHSVDSSRAKVSILHNGKGHKESKRVLDAWTRIIKSKPRRDDDPEEKVHRALFTEAHAHYKEAYAEQQSLMKTGEFNRRVAAAMTRFPRFENLHISDHVHAHVQEEHWDIPVRPGVSLRDAYFRPMAFGITGRQAWDRKRTTVAQSNLYPTMIHLPIALQQAGVAVKEFVIAVYGLREDSVLECDLVTLRSFSSAVQSVRTVYFVGSPVINLRSRQSMSRLPIYLSHLLSNPSLKEINIDICGIEHTYFFDNMEPNNDPWVNFPGSCLTQHTPGLQRKALDKVRLWRASFRCAELLDLISAMPTRIREFHLEEVKLLDGTWEEIIDRLRKKEFTSEYSVKLYALKGGELDLDDDEDGELQDIFCHDSDGTDCNYLEQYSMRFKQRNPLRLYREGEWDANEYLDEEPGEPEPYE